MVVKEFKNFVSGFVKLVGMERLEHNQRIGKGRVVRLSSEYESQGFKVWNNRMTGMGIDMVVFRDDKPIEAAEISNYAELSFMSPKNFRRYVDDLNDFGKLFPNAKKRMYVSFLKNLSEKQICEFCKNEIEVVVCGFQDEEAK